jgi:hypothetical protein
MLEESFRHTICARLMMLGLALAAMQQALAQAPQATLLFNLQAMFADARGCVKSFVCASPAVFQAVLSDVAGNVAAQVLVDALDGRTGNSAELLVRMLPLGAGLTLALGARNAPQEVLSEHEPSCNELGQVVHLLSSVLAVFLERDEKGHSRVRKWLQEASEEHAKATVSVLPGVCCVLCAASSELYAVSSELCAVCSVSSVQCAVCSVQCAVCCVCVRVCVLPK